MNLSDGAAVISFTSCMSFTFVAAVITFSLLNIFGLLSAVSAALYRPSDFSLLLQAVNM